jgi:multiple sugar transport system permease protein
MLSTNSHTAWNPNGHTSRSLSSSYTGGLLALTPTLFVIAFLIVLPGLYALLLGMSDLKGFHTLWVDKLFVRSLKMSFSYSLTTVALQVVLGTLAATIVHRSRFAIGTTAWLLFIPYAVPSVVAVVAWKFLILDHAVFPNVLQRAFGIPSHVWMGDWIFWTLVIISVWQFYPFVFLSLLARMRRIPPTLYRNAELDGAHPFHQFVFVTLPSIKGTLITVIILRFAFMFTKFDTPWLLVGGTANDAVDTLPIYVYRNMGMDIYLKPGISAAVVMASILFVVLLVLFAVRRFLKAEDL